MAASAHTVAEDHGDYIVNRSWLIFFSFVLTFGIVWTLVGDSSSKLLFTAVAFVFFLRAGIKTEMSARALCDTHH
jgi:hypothetical protein